MYVRSCFGLQFHNSRRVAVLNFLVDENDFLWMRNVNEVDSLSMTWDE
jgi:hypothetical protein